VTLSYSSGRPGEIRAGQHVVLAVIRNEALRLPYFLAYYRARGFDRFIFVDNGSTDGARDLVRDAPDCFLFETDESYAASGYGLSWTNLLLDAFCGDHWVLVADADEILVWPGSETKSVAELTRGFDRVQAEALFTVLLDMYSDRPFGEIGYRPGDDLPAAAPFFDRGPYRMIASPRFPFRQAYGGVRDRLFRSIEDVPFHPPTVSKIPLVRWREGQRFILSTHELATPLKLAPMRGALLHFKMLDDLYEKCRIEVARGEHYEGAREYRALGAAIQKAARRSFYDPAISARFTSTKDLLALGVLSRQAPF
jgi:hypothetical protein